MKTCARTLISQLILKVNALFSSALTVGGSLLRFSLHDETCWTPRLRRMDG